MRPYAGIPHSDRPGLFIEENVALLRRFAYLEERLCYLQCAHFSGTAILELKHALARHAWEDGQHADALRRRIVTMRTSRRTLEQCPDPALAALLDEAERAADSVELLAGVHGVIKPALLAAYRWHLETTNPVADFPTARELEIVVREEAHQLAWAAEAIAELAGEAAAAAAGAVATAAGGLVATHVTSSEPLARTEIDALPGAAQGGPPVGRPLTPEAGAPQRALQWQAHLRTFLAAAGGISGREPTAQPEAARSVERFRISRHPRRDPRFTINFNFNEPGDPQAQTIEEKLIFMMRGRLNELAATENPASAVYELSQQAEGLPWEGLLELVRHMWDEARHSMLGQAVISSLGRDIREWPLRIGPGYSYLSVGALERYAHLGLNVEQGSMRYPPGKRQEYEWCRDVAGNRLAAMYQDYDWSDETYHTQIARRWVSAALAAGAVGEEQPDEAAAGWAKLREYAQGAGQRMSGNTQAIAGAWQARRARGETLGPGDPLPTGAGGATEIVDEYRQDPELTLTREQVEADLRHAE
ncbi:MAG TPA: hypothetical protein VNM16_10205 [Bacillota bacterium]|nr:hypothetical protein [Bacillota bacterium]